jgi:hypothetical protein
MDEEKNIHINIIKNGKEAIDKSTNKSETYIILMNEELNNKNREQIEEIKDLNSQIVDLEDQSDRSEKSITYMRGLLKNMIGVKNMVLSLNKLYTEKYKNNNQKMEFINKFLIDLNLLIRILPLVSGLVLLFTFLMNIINLYEILVLIFVFGLTGLIILTYSKISTQLFLKYDSFQSEVEELNKDYDVQIKELRLKIKKVEDSNDFLNEFVDNI